MANTLSHKAMISTLQVSSWGNRRKQDDVAEEVMTKKGANHAFGNFTKRLLGKDATKDIRTIRSKARAFHNFHTRPWLDDGSRILPSVLYADYAKQMRKYTDDFDQAVADFLKEYPKHVAAAKRELGDMYNAEDYPPAAELRTMYAMRVTIAPFPDKQDFRVDLDPTTVSEIKAELEQRVKEQITEAVKSVGLDLSEVVGHMARTLKAYKPKTNAKKAEGTFRDSLVENVKELAALLPAFNFTDDAKLSTIHKRIMKELCNADPEALREDDNARKTVQKSAEQILKTIEEFMQ